MDLNPCFFKSNNMHKIYSQLIIFIALVFIASSCNSSRGISVTKRHYSKGNYVSVSKSPKPFVHHIPSKKSLPVVVPSTEVVSTTPELNKLEKQIVANVDEKLDATVLPSNNRFDDMINTSEINSTHEKASNISDLSKVKKGNRLFSLNKIQPNGEARSLFWLVITILLIIWLIALISGGWGLGGLVNILLVIALVLFILWLLRLI